MKQLTNKPIEIYLFLLFLILFFAIDLLAHIQIRALPAAQAQETFPTPPNPAL